MGKVITINEILTGTPTGKVKNWIQCPVCGTVKVEFTGQTVIDGWSRIDLKCEINHMFYVWIGSNNGNIAVQAEIRTGYTSYQDYLRSPEWLAKATEIKNRIGKCQTCGRGGDAITLHVHHNTYERVKHELDSDLIVLCSDCHAKYHNIQVNTYA